MSDSDSGLLARWRAGETDAGEELMARHVDALSRFFGNKVSSGVDDLVQASVLACLEGVERFRGEASFRTYLFKIARFQLYEAVRRQRREQALDFTEASAPSPQSSPADVFAAAEQERVLADALRELPVAMQTALEFHYWKGLTIAEIAEVQGVAPGTVASWIHRARQRLASSLQTAGLR